MLVLKVSGMTCGGCVNAITRAIIRQDNQAKVSADLAANTVLVKSVLSENAIRQAISEADFPVLDQIQPESPS